MRVLGDGGGPAHRTDLTAAAQRVCDRARSGLTASGREVHGPSGPSVLVDVPELELARVLRNLVDNAALHGEGAVRVAVLAQHGVAVLTVTDEGAGPPTGFVPHAVERLRRADGAQAALGSGLGLSVVHEVGTAHGGELRLCSGGSGDGGHHRFPPLRVDGPCGHPQPGTTVSVLLPVAP